VLLVLEMVSVQVLELVRELVLVRERVLALEPVQEPVPVLARVLELARHRQPLTRPTVTLKELKQLSVPFSFISPYQYNKKPV